MNTTMLTGTFNHMARQWRDRLLNQQMLNAFDMSDDTMDAYLERIRTVRPVCLYGYASSMASICNRRSALLPTRLIAVTSCNTNSVYDIIAQRAAELCNIFEGF